MLGGRLTVVVLLAVAAYGCTEEEIAPSAGMAMLVASAGDPERAGEIGGLLATLAAEARVDLLADEPLASRLGQPAAAALSACGADLTCIGGLGERAAVREVLLVRTKTPADGPVVGQFLVVSASSKTIVRRAQIELAAGRALERQLRAEANALFGVALPPPPEAVAHCDVVEGVVRVRRKDQEDWRPLTAGDELAVGDLVETGPTGVTRIRYTGGASIDLSPRSQLVIGAARDDANRVTLRAGTLRGQMGANSRVVVESPDGEEIGLAAERGRGEVSYRVGVRDGDTVEVAVSDGRAEVTTGGETTTLAAGSARDVRDGALAETIELPDFPKLDLPGVDATVMFHDELAVALKWQAWNRPGVRYHVQVAEDQSFHRLLLDEVVPAAKRVFRPPGPTTLHWRVATQNAAGREGEFGFSRRIYVTPEKIPDLLVSPADGATFEFEPFAPRFVSFSWRAAVPPAPYVLVFGKRRDNLFRPKVLEIVSSAQKVTTRQLNPGEYYWGVFVKRKSGLKPIFRRSRQVTIVQ